MSAEPGRRFRFSLRTLFLVVAALGIVSICAKVQLDWIEKRHKVASENLAMIVAYKTGMVGTPSPMKPVTAPAALWLFGEKGYDRLELVVVVDSYDDLPPVYSFEKLHEARRLFPEADIGGIMITSDDLRKSAEVAGLP